MHLSCSCSAWKSPLPDTLAAIKGIGFTHADLIAIPGWNQIVPAAVAADFETETAAIEAAVASSGLMVAALNCAFPSPQQRDAETNADRRAQARAIARLMGRLGVGLASFYPGFRQRDRAWEDLFEASLPSYREILEAGREAGVEFLLEPHANTPFETPDEIRRLFEALPELRVAYDPSHFAAQNLPPAETHFVLQRAAHVHIRDAGPGKIHLPCGEGTIDFAGFVADLRSHGYDGPIAIEALPGKDGANEADVIRLRETLTPLLD
ncbi:MAG: sugar phosphate isomerase/epimerase [Puniceicoccaceae bacterium]|nr:MAG: sugar phosphate isomerase/epimerase [Puniceicoccaceae bacterium]